MDWNLKGASWDLTELDEAALPNIETIENNNNNGSSRFGFGVGLMNRSKGEFCVDLKLGHQVGNNSGTQESSGAKWKDHAVAVAAATAAGGVSKTTSSACSGSSKRARAISNGAQTASCLVDGCNSDLSNCRDYHRRHKVCELHSKTPVVTIGGHKQRFCQQCSRFHSLEEFDEGKRSCRKRLDGHNRRRRKPQPVPLTRSASFLSNYQGTQMLPFPSSSHVYPSSGTVNPCWDARFQQVHKQELLILGSSAMATPTSSYNNKEGNDNKQQERAYLQGDKYGRRVAVLSNQNADLEAVSAPASVCQTLVRTGRPFSIEESPPCALSLLSSPVQAHTPMSLVQPLGLTLHDHTLESVDTTVLVNNGTSLYHMGSHGSPQSHPFHWE